MNSVQPPPVESPCPSWCWKDGSHAWASDDSGYWRNHVSHDVGEGRNRAVVAQWEDLADDGGSPNLDAHVITFPALNQRPDGRVEAAEVDPGDTESLIANLRGAKALVEADS